MGHEVFNLISQSLGLILQIATLISVVYAFYRFTKKPEESLDARVTSLEVWRDKAEERLNKGDVHFVANDESNRVTQSALVAIMDALGSMDTVPPEARAEIKARKKDLMDYLTDKTM